ncbi:HD family phosphohydrolase [Prescottella agglutinans]|uniref:HD family phosphohydrolase n=1 Tax=Prescottella agglutinans TaxID=1644129 RepID=A0A3S3EB04_9NOCA|nr:HD family phosphohydrolase [Prescottella agglutinans]RVW09834.1 HD family phosphohydrolase [Prescottella agglutinans]
MNDDSAVLEEAAALLNSLCGVFDGEAVDELDHALQSAGRAIADGADDDLVLASALHDLARSPLTAAPADAPHDRVARAWLTPRFGERVGWLAGAHVAAKRYLAATDPAYVGTLSSESMATLRHQGGPAVAEEWVSHPWWSDAVRLRRYDDGAKVPGAQAPSIDEILAVARRVRVGRAAR